MARRCGAIRTVYTTGQFGTAALNGGERRLLVPADERVTWLMPIISVQLVRGRTPEMKRALMRELADAAVRTLGVPATSVRVLLTEMESDHWGVGFETKTEIDARAAAAKI